MNKWTTMFAVLALLVIGSTNTFATDLNLVGSGTYVVDGDSISVTFNRIENNDPSTTSGSIYLKLIASPDNDPTGSSYILTEIPLSTFPNINSGGVLEPGQSYTNISFTGSYAAPPPGNYYVFLMVSEWPDTNTILDTSPAVNNPSFLGGTSGGGSSSGGSSSGGSSSGGSSSGGSSSGGSSSGGSSSGGSSSGGSSSGGSSSGGSSSGGTSSGGPKLDLECPCAWETSGSRINLQADRITNMQPGMSGTLKLELWATKTPYAGGSISGYKLGEYRFSEQLGANAYYYDIDQTVPYSPPPYDSYYTTLVVTQWANSEFLIVDYKTFSSTSKLGTQNIFTGGSGGGGGGGGGGGSSSYAFLLLLGCLAVARKKFG